MSVDKASKIVSICGVVEVVGVYRDICSEFGCIVLTLLEAGVEISDISGVVSSAITQYIEENYTRNEYDCEGVADCAEKSSID